MTTARETETTTTKTTTTTATTTITTTATTTTTITQEIIHSQPCFYDLHRPSKVLSMST